MQQSSSREANSHSASQEISRIYGTQMFITVFTRGRHYTRKTTWRLREIDIYSTEISHELFELGVQILAWGYVTKKPTEFLFVNTYRIADDSDF
jgi:hypothetical protein